MLTVGLGEPPASITGIKGLLLAHFGVAVGRSGLIGVCPRRPGSTVSSARAGSATSACSRRWPRVPRELFVPEELRAAAYDDAPVPLPSDRRSRSPTSSRSCARGSRSPAASGCSTSAPARATRPPCSPSWPPSVAHDRADPRARRRGARRARGGGLRAGLGPRRRRHARAPGARRRSTRSPSPPPARELPAALWEQLREGGRIALPLGSGSGAGSASACSSASPDGPAVVALDAGPLRPARAGQSEQMPPDGPASLARRGRARTPRRAGAAASRQLDPAREVRRRRRESATRSTSASTRCCSGSARPLPGRASVLVRRRGG